MAVFQRQQIGIEATGSSVTIADDARARLMYYIDCICDVIELDDGNLTRLRNYRNYSSLSSDEVEKLMAMAILLEPRPLIGKVLFQEDAMCGNSSNKFYKLNEVTNNLAVVGSLVIGGQRKRTTKIMCFKMVWLNRNYLEPLKELVEKRQREKEQAARARSRDNSCYIM
jgi:hypothetical protein